MTRREGNHYGHKYSKSPKSNQTQQKQPYPTTTSHPRHGYAGIASQSKIELDGLFLQGLNLAQFRGIRTIFPVVLLVHTHHTCSTQAQIVLQGIFQVGHLSLPAMPQNCKQSSAHCAKPVTPRKWSLLMSPPESLADHYSSAIGVVAFVDELSRLALLAQAQGLLVD